MDGIQGELFEILDDDKNLPEAQVQAIAKQLVSLDIPLQFFLSRVMILDWILAWVSTSNFCNIEVVPT